MGKRGSKDGQLNDQEHYYDELLSSLDRAAVGSTGPPRPDYNNVYLRDRPNPDYDPEAEPLFTESLNARDWARAFVATVTAYPKIATDEATMVEWFANALMRGYDERSRIIAQSTGVETGQTKWDDRATDAVAPWSRPTGVFERRVLQRIEADPVGVLAGDLLEMLASEQVRLSGEDLEALSRGCRKAAETCYGGLRYQPSSSAQPSPEFESWMGDKAARSEGRPRVGWEREREREIEHCRSLAFQDAQDSGEKEGE